MFIFVKNLSSFISKIQYHTVFLEPIYMTKRMMECGSKGGETTSSHHQYYTQWSKTVLGHVTPLWVHYSKTLTGSDLCSFISWRHSEIDDNQS